MLQNGKMKQFIPENGIYVNFRYNDDKTVMIIANNNFTDKTLNLSRFREMFNFKSEGIDIFSGKSYKLENDIPVSYKSVMMLELK